MGSASAASKLHIADTDRVRAGFGEVAHDLPDRAGDHRLHLDLLHAQRAPLPGRANDGFERVEVEEVWMLYE